ncbi:MAG TPA: protein kinase, partial [Polyangiales bacterium]|nr:protein kinase [Polyangiales bacterium]
MTPDAAAIEPSLVGQSLEGGYVLEERLGAGSLGETYRAKHIEHQRVVIVKLLHDDVSGDALRRSRFAWEAATLGGLSHPNIPALLDYGVHCGRRYLVREWMDGESLDRRLARGPLPLESALGIVRQLLAALAAVHGARLLHRNLRPSNLFLERRKQGRERLRLLDFAPASTRRPRGLDPVFTPPELLGGEVLDTRSDVFAVGAILTAMLRGAALEPRVRVLTPLPLAPRPVVDVDMANLEPAGDAELSAAEGSGAHQRPSQDPLEAASEELPASGDAANTNGVRTANTNGSSGEAHGRAHPAQKFPLAATPTAPDERGRARLGPDSSLQRWLRRSLAPDRERRFADAAEMLRELIDVLPRELRSPGDDQVAPHRPASAGSTLAPVVPQPPAAAPSLAVSTPPVAEAPNASLAWLSPPEHPAVRFPDLVRGPSAAARVLPAPLTEAPAVALPQTRGEPGLTRLTAAAMGGAFLLAVVLIFVQPGEFGRTSRGSLHNATARAAQQQEPARARGAVRVQPETTQQAARAPIPVEVIDPKPQSAATAAPSQPNAVGTIAGKNPWLQSLPAELDGLPGLVASGAIGDENIVRRLRSYTAANPNDPRGLLLLGRLYLNRMWRNDAVT